MLTDSHCHLQFNSYNINRKEVINRCLEKDMVLNIVGTQKNTSKKAVELAEKYDNFYATIGLHPIHLFPTHVDEEEDTFISKEEDFDEDYYGELAQSKKVIAVGECGIDLFHLPKDKSLTEVLKKQKQVFQKQIDFAIKNNLALVVHTRDGINLDISAYDEVIKVIKAKISDKKPQIRGVIHCYTSNWHNAKKFLDLGFYLGFTGVITFPPKKTDPRPQLELLEVIKKCPLDKILVETDSPYLAPQKYRGKQAEPWMTEEVIKKIAEIKNLDEADVRNITIENTKKLFTKII